MLYECYTIVSGFVYLLTACSGNLIAKEAGIYPVVKEDMAIIFFVTVQNQCDDELHVSVKMKRCIEHVENDQYFDTIQLLGGDMGTVRPHGAKNLTLIYPNLYLTNRMGMCEVIIDYRDPKNPEKCSQFVREICFNTTISHLENCCESADMDPSQGCTPVDCRIKYAGQKSFYNTHSKRCTEVPQCVANLDLPLPDVAYNPVSNQCKGLRNAVSKADLVLLENNNFKDCGHELAYGQFMCHNGHICNSSGECVCSEGWITSLEDNYEPSLGIYHMCNVEINGWINVNKSRIKLTALLISIFAITIASKILIIMCILNMCFKWAKSSKKGPPEAEFKKPCLCNEELIKKSSEKMNSGEGDNETTMNYTCPDIKTGCPFVARTPRSCAVKTSTSSSASTATAEEIHIYVERAKTDSISTKISNTDFSIEFLEEEEDAKGNNRPTSGRGSTRPSSTSTDSRKNAS